MEAHSEVPASIGASQSAPLHSDDVVARDYANASASGSHRHSGEDGPPGPDDTDASLPKRVPSPTFTNESRSSSPSPSVKPVENEGPTDFSQPGAVEEQRIIWLPKDRLGLVREIEQDLNSRGVLYSTEGAEMDSQGRVNVTMAPPEEVQRTYSEAGSLRSPDDGEGDVTSDRPKSSESSKV